jgi:hypothetical protein
MKTASGPGESSTSLYLVCLCLIATLSSCFFDASKLRPPAHDGDVDSPELPDAVLGGSGGTAGEVGSGGSTGADGAAVFPDLATANDVAPFDHVAAPPDLPTAGEVGGGAGGSAEDAGGTGGAGGNAEDAGGTGGTGGNAEDAGGTGGAGGNAEDAGGTGGAGVDGNGTGGAGGNGPDATPGVDSPGTSDGTTSQDGPVDVAATDGTGGAGGTGGRGGTGGTGGTGGRGGTGGAGGTGGRGGTGGTGGTGADTDLVLWYKFDESTGTTAADSSMYSSAARNATLATIGMGGSAVFSTVKQVGTHAVRLTPASTSPNANCGYVTVPALQTLAPSALTIAVWVNLAAATAAQDWERIFDFGTGNAAMNYMYLAARDGNSFATPVQFVISTNGHTATSGQVLEGLSALTPNLWHHVAIVLPAGPTYTGTMYIDGVPAATNSAMTLHATDIGATTNNWLGRSQFSGASGNDPCFNGYLDDFRVYRRALSQTEISALFAVR